MADFVEKISNNGLSIYFDSVSYGVRWFISNCYANGYRVGLNIDTVDNIYFNSNNDLVIRSGFGTDSYKYILTLEKGDKKFIASLTFTKTSRTVFSYELNVYIGDLQN